MNEPHPDVEAKRKAEAGTRQLLHQLLAFLKRAAQRSDPKFDLLLYDIIAITMATPSDACLPDRVSAISKGQRDSEDRKEPRYKV